MLIVRADWLFASVRCGHRLAEQSYLATTSGAKSINMRDDAGALRHFGGTGSLPSCARQQSQRAEPFDGGAELTAVSPHLRDADTARCFQDVASVEPDEMLDVVARLTTAVKQTSKRCVPQLHLNIGTSILRQTMHSRGSRGGELESGLSYGLHKVFIRRSFMLRFDVLRGCAPFAAPAVRASGRCRDSTRAAVHSAARSEHAGELRA